MQTNTLDIVQMQAQASKAADLLKAMSNEHRLLILCHLGQQEMSVGQLNACINLSQSSLSQHLARLRKDGLVNTRRESQTIYYSIADEVVMKLITLLHEEYCQRG
ncbi:MAG: DNA-binding transcriptional ArsR family regulator [Phenylobacterium sp.]|jgi:DNA-binding transcriptional ArsR family regulator